MWSPSACATARREVLTVADVTCGRDNCCWFLDGDWWQAIPASKQSIIGAKFCRKTGAALLVLERNGEVLGVAAPAPPAEATVTRAEVEADICMNACCKTLHSSDGWRWYHIRGDDEFVVRYCPTTGQALEPFVTQHREPGEVMGHGPHWTIPEVEAIAREVATVRGPVTCGNECCIYHPAPWGNVCPQEAGWYDVIAATADDILVERRFCPHTGERLLVVDGQPVVLPRPSPGYVRLLEEAARELGRWHQSRWIHGTMPKACYQRWTAHGPTPCTHEDPPIGCLRALSAEREKEGGDRGE